ncbi:Proliferating cell nuclear antigen [Spatholobus suberectus]|nr:Proliferating cell nuclear antigen [Spatholobus suberectus]
MEGLKFSIKGNIGIANIHEEVAVIEMNKSMSLILCIAIHQLFYKDNTIVLHNTSVDNLHLSEEATMIKMNEPVLTFALQYKNSFTTTTPLSCIVTISLLNELLAVEEYKIAKMGHV